jgi:hypothetical protein
LPCTSELNPFSTQAEENCWHRVVFWLAAEEYRLFEHADGLRLRKAEQIIELYLAHGAVMAVTVELSMYDEIELKLHDDVDKQAFVPFQKIVFDQIERDEFKRFLPSIHGKRAKYEQRIQNGNGHKRTTSIHGRVHFLGTNMGFQVDEAGFCEDEGLLQTMASCLHGLKVDSMQESVDLVPGAQARIEVKKLKKRVKESIRDVQELLRFIRNLNMNEKLAIPAQINLVSTILRRTVANLAVAPRNVYTRQEKDIKSDLELLTTELQRMRDLVEKRSRCPSHSNLFREISFARSRLRADLEVGKPRLPRGKKGMRGHKRNTSRSLKLQGSRRQLKVLIPDAGADQNPPCGPDSDRESATDWMALNMTVDDRQERLDKCSEKQLHWVPFDRLAS